MLTLSSLVGQEAVDMTTAGATSDHNLKSLSFLQQIWFSSRSLYVILEMGEFMD